MTPQEFSQKIKAKYPEYKDIDDAELTTKIIQKYPQYSSQVNLGTQAEPGFIERAGERISEAGGQVEKAISGTGEFEGQSPLRRGVEATAAAFDAIPAVATEALPKPARTGLEKVGEALSGAVKFLGDKIGNIPAVQKWVTEHPQAATALEEVAGISSAGGRIAGDVLLAEGVKTGAQKTVDTANKARTGTVNLIGRSKELIKPTPTPEKAAGEVIQGRTPTDTRKGVEALRNVDTEGVNTFAELEKRINKSIGDLSGKVDEHLGQDPTPIPLQNLVTKTTSGSGRVVERNFVSTAIEHLKELYAKTADDVAKADIDDLAAKANTSGLTRLEVNDISRLYNTEFGEKAFGKLGDPLTSVNAQMYENIRSGLKDVARKGMGGAEAAATDKVISALYNTKGLIKKNAAAVQKLQQRIAERGLLEKVGHAVSKYGDILSGGSIRGFIGGLLPRGAGYKVLNALDLEERLRGNLEIINKALNAADDAAVITATKELAQSLGQPKTAMSGATATNFNESSQEQVRPSESKGGQIDEEQAKSAADMAMNFGPGGAALGIEKAGAKVLSKIASRIHPEDAGVMRDITDLVAREYQPSVKEANRLELDARRLWEHYFPDFEAPKTLRGVSNAFGRVLDLVK